MLERPSSESLSISIGQHSAAGRKAENQDFHGALIPDDNALALKGISLAIADGISSSEVSHIAAETAVKSFLEDYYCTSDSWTVKTSGRRVITATNSWLHAQTHRSRLHADMNRGFVCTFSAMVLKGRKAHLFHVGDSRISRLVAGNFEQLTSDHRTILSPSESYLARAIGLSTTVEIEHRTLSLRPGDIFVMTTDGVHEHVSGPEMAALIIKADDFDEAASAIVEKALSNGSKDNLTIQIVRIDSLPSRNADTILQSVDLLPPAPIPQVGSVYDGYRIVRQLHGSSRSHIFLAVDQETGAKVALKVPSVDLRDNLDYLRRFAMEEWIARRLNSPHVLKATSARRERDTLYVVTELVEGQTLRQWIADNPQPDIEVVRDIVEQVSKGLRAFHRREMVHQDLRPENIMIDRDGTVKIIDFGAVSVAGVLEADPGFDTGDILGTHQYAAPEYFVGGAGSVRSDLYALGVIAYEMLTGHLPYGARMARASNASQQERVAYTPVTTYRQDLPVWLDDALKKAVHPDPARRQEALSEFTHDLRHARPGSLTARTVPIIEKNPLLFWKTACAVLALSVLALLIWR